jgi:ketosteroid isomerase-like protein
MSRENVARLRPVYAEWAKGDFHAGLGLLEPDVVFRAFETFEERGPYLPWHGGHRGLHSPVPSSVDDLKIEARTFTVAGGRVLAECRRAPCMTVIRVRDADPIPYRRPERTEPAPGPVALRRTANRHAGYVAGERGDLPVTLSTTRREAATEERSRRAGGGN